MKPIAIFRHAAIEGPGYLAEFLDERLIPWQLIAIDAGAAVPSSAEAYSGLVFMGGPMSVNDDLPWIAPTLALICEAVGKGIGRCGDAQSGQRSRPLPSPQPSPASGRGGKRIATRASD
jgi:GMP synthase-like glutamine amidotransferase